MVPVCSKAKERELEDGDDTLKGSTVKEGEADKEASK